MMKTLAKTIIVVVLLIGMTLASQAQQQKRELVVTTRLKETNGSYAQRKLYRSFLEGFMKDCPYITHFHVQEAMSASNNHKVVWIYEVNSWGNITQFYNWIHESLKSTKNTGLKKALTPYKPDYEIGGKIQVEEKSKTSLAMLNDSQQ